MAYEDVKSIFPSEGNLCLKGCGECCDANSPLSESEANEIGKWLVDNATYEQLRDQFWHADTQPGKCPFLTPEKTCFIYPARPIVCIQFGHLPDPKGVPKDITRIISQKCPKGVKFTEVDSDIFVNKAIVWYIESLRSHAPIGSLRKCLVFVREDGVEGPMPEKK